MNPHIRTFRQLDRLETTLGELLLEVRFVVSLIEATPPQPLTVHSEALIAVMMHMARQQEAARGIATQEIRAMRKS